MGTYKSLHLCFLIKKFKIMRQFLLFSIFLYTTSIYSQKAFDFTAKDIQGNTHNLFDILSTGKHVLLDVSATWCGPCWSFKQSGVMEDYMDKYGPEGTNDAMVFFIEGDATTGMADLLGNTSNSQGDWVTGANYPIIDNAAIGTLFDVSSFPTLIVVCPDRSIKTDFARSLAGIESAALSCSQLTEVSIPDFRVDQRVGCNSLDVNFVDNSWPRPTSYLWDFGDGNTSDLKNPSHTYESAGNYSVALNVKDNFGENKVTKTDYINIGDGFGKELQEVGPKNKDFATGRYFEGGHHALIIDVYSPFVLESVKVYSSKEMDRTFVLLDDKGEIVNSKTINIPVGEHEIYLNFYFPTGNNYKLGMHSEAYLFRNDGNALYPYVIENVMSIKESTAAPTNPRYYYYYYDMKIKEAGCTNINTPTSNITELTYQIIPNPAHNYIEIDLNGISESSMVVTNAVGSVVSFKALVPNTKNVVSINDLLPGLYFVTIGRNTKKLIIE